MKTPKKILCLSTTGMGNAILYTPVINSLVSNYPNATIDLILSNFSAKCLLDGYPGIRNIIYWPKKETSFFNVIKMLIILRKEKYDLFIGSFLDKSIKVSVFAFLLNIPVRVGFSNKWWEIFYTHKIQIQEQKHEVEYNLDLLRAISVNKISKNMSLFLNNNEKQYADEYIQNNNLNTVEYIVGFHPGSGTDIGNNIKRWPIDKFIEVANELTKTLNSSVLLFGGKDEINLAEIMISNMDLKPLSLTGNTDIRQTAALIAKCDLFITNDSGLMHIAAAQNVPVIAIFGPTLAWKNYPWQVKNKIIKSNLLCSPCYNFKVIKCESIRCLKEIKSSDVLNAIKELITEISTEL